MVAVVSVCFCMSRALGCHFEKMKMWKTVLVKVDPFRFFGGSLYDMRYGWTHNSLYDMRYG